MTTPVDCAQNSDPLKLVREGTSQDARLPQALDPAYAPVNERTVGHGIVFAQGYAALLKYFETKKNTAAGDWVPFFGNDVSVPLAVAAIEDLTPYKANTKSWFDYLNNSQNQSNENQLKDRFGYLYSHVATLAEQLDALKDSLPAEIALKGMLQNLIRSQLAPAIWRLVAYYKAGIKRGLIDVVVPDPAVQVLRRAAVTFDSVLNTPGLSKDWSEGLAWTAYAGAIPEDASVYGSGSGVFDRINHCATHNLFTSIFDQFLRVFARVVSEAGAALDGTLTNWNRHEPHYALYLAFLRLLEHARTSSNTLTRRHLDFYYREILGLQEKGAEPSHVHLLAELNRQIGSHAFKPGLLFKAGKDDQRKDVFFANDRDLVANHAEVTALKTVYRHGDEPLEGPLGSTTIHAGRLYASPVANSDDGLGAPLTSVDQSWHPFFNKAYADGALAEIRMPRADVGFAVASHHLLLAEGERTISLTLAVTGFSGGAQQDFAEDVRCLLTAEKGWLEKTPESFKPDGPGKLTLTLKLNGADPAIRPYLAKTHGFTFQTGLPVLLVMLKHDDGRVYVYPKLQSAIVHSITLAVTVENLRSLSVSNDFGPVDTSKPFQPFGPSPVQGSSLTIGSKEAFQKKLVTATINLNWLAPPSAYGSLPNVETHYLNNGQWTPSNGATASVTQNQFDLDGQLDLAVLDQADLGASEFYGTQSRRGFVKLALTNGFGQVAYQTALIDYLKNLTATNPGTAPVGPTAAALSMSYTSRSDLALDESKNYQTRPGQFFHVVPFGTAERHPYLTAGALAHLLPQFEFQRDNAPAESEAELYIGISALQPPQSLSLLFQVAAGTANPDAPKPERHIDWSYLSNNDWKDLAENEVQDETGGLLNSAIVTLAVPRDATSTNTLLPAGLFWIRAAVQTRSDAVCRLQLVAAQAMRATFADRDNSPGFAATPLPAGTITKLNAPDPAVKAISQPFPSFGGRGAEAPTAFYTRVSERLRHKDRAIDLWDYERLVLEAFPQIYKVKCLNHTHYDQGIYRELAPGHVTIVTIPNLQGQNLRDPLKPSTSLGTLQQIGTYLRERTGCFVQLHVKNPTFEEVRVRCKVRLYDGFDETYYLNSLRQEITRFLSPWAFANGRMPSFGGRLYKSVLIDFIEDRPYVDYVTDFQLFRDIDGAQGTVDLDEVQGSKALSILVSAPAGKHEITILKTAPQAVSGESCRCEA